MAGPADLGFVPDAPSADVGFVPDGQAADVGFVPDKPASFKITSPAGFKTLEDYDAAARQYTEGLKSADLVRAVGADVVPAVSYAVDKTLHNKFTKGVGIALDTTGKMLASGAKIGLETVTGNPGLAKQEISALTDKIQGPYPGQEAVESPYDEARKTLPLVPRATAGVGMGLVESAPQLALAAVQPELGAVSFGFTPDGFDPVTAGTMLIAPGGGKMIGGIAERVAAKAGISSEQARALINRVGGASGIAGIMSAPTVYQISQMPAGPERDAASEEAASNAILIGVLGAQGERKPAVDVGFVPDAVSPEANTAAAPGETPPLQTQPGVENVAPGANAGEVSGAQAPKTPVSTVPQPVRNLSATRPLTTDAGGIVRTPDGAIDPVQTALNKMRSQGAPLEAAEPTTPATKQDVVDLHNAIADLRASLANPFKPSESQPAKPTEEVQPSQPAEAEAAPAVPAASPADHVLESNIVGHPDAKNMPEWARQEMIARGLDPNRPLNDLDVKNPSVVEAIKSDPTLTEEQKAQMLKTGSPKAMPTDSTTEAGAPPVSADQMNQRIDEIVASGERRRQAASVANQHLRPSPVDWLDSDELAELHKLQQSYPKQSRVDALARLAVKRKLTSEPEKKTTAGTETDAGGSQQSESNLPSGRSSPTVTEPTAAVKPRRVGRGHTSGKVFDRETELGGPDILSWIRDEMPMMSKSAAQKSRGAEWWQRNKSLYDDSAPLSRPHHNKIYGGKSSPDQVAQEAHKAGLLKSPDVADLWEVIKTASERRRGVFEQQRSNEKLLMEQAEWHKATAKGELRVRGEDLQPGDAFEVDGERFVVKRVDKATGDVELQDGKKFGRQTLQRDASIWIEKPDEAISDRVADSAGSDSESSSAGGEADFDPSKDSQAQFKVGDKVLHEGQIKTVTKAVPGSDFIGVGKRAIHIKELKLATAKDKAEVVAKKLEKLKSGVKGGKGGQLHAFGLAADLWDRAVSIAQSVIRAGGSIADAITAAIKHIRENHQGQFDEAGTRAKLNEAVRDEAMERVEPTPAEPDDVPPDRERSMDQVKGDLADSEARVKDLTRDLVNPQSGSKKERQQAMYKEAARYRNLREELLHHPDYIAEQLAAQNAAITEANAILKPHGQAVRPDDFPNLEKLRDVLPPEQFKRLQDLSRQIEVSHGELVRMPKKMVARIYSEMQDDGRLPESAPGNPDVGRSLDNVTNWLRSNGVDSPRKTLAERLNLGARVAEMLRSAKTSAQKALQTAQGLWKAALESYKSPPKDDDFRSVIKSWIYADQRTARANQDFVNEVVRQVSNTDRRKAMSIWLDADGDANLLKLQAESVPDAYRKPWDLAMKLTDSEKQLAMKIKQDFADKLEDGQTVGILDQGRADYGAPQLWKLKPETQGDPTSERKKGSPGNPFAKLDSRSPFFAFQRETPSYFDGIMSKGVPENLDIAHLVSTYDRAFHKALSSRGMVAALQEAKAKDGLPVVKISGNANMVKGQEGNTYFVDSKAWNESNVTADGRPYRSLDHSSLKGWKLAFKDQAGNPIVVKGDMLIHPDHFLYLKNELGQSALRDGDVSKALNPVFQSQAFLKASKLSGSAFHLMTIGEHMASHLVNPFTGGFKIDLRQPDQSLLVRNGLIASLDHARMAYEEGLMSGHGGLFNKIPGLGDLSAKMTDWMFNEYIPTIMMKTGLKMLESNRARYSKDTWEGKKLTDDQIAELTANQMNSAGGLLNKRIGGADGNIFGRLGSNKTMMDLQRMALMAPQFLEARMRVVGQALKPYGHEQRKLLIVQAGLLYVGCRVLNQLLDGDPHWNDNPFSVVHNGRAYSIRTIVGDFYHLLTDPASFAAGRLSPFAKIAMEDGVMGGRDLRTGTRKDLLVQTQIPISRLAQNVVMDVANWLTPIPVEGLLPGSAGKDQTAGSMALSSVGVGSRKFTAAGQVYKLAADFNRNSPDAKANNWQATRDNGSFGHSAYAKLDALLDAGKLDAAKSEYRALLGEGKTPLTIAERYSRATYFTGSAEREQKFLASLTPAQREAYKKAKGEQAERGQVLRKMLSQ